MGGLGFPAYDAPDPGLAGDLVEARFDLSTDLVSQYDAASTSALGSLGNASFSVPMGNLDLPFDEVNPPAIGEPPTPTAVTPYTSQMQAVVLSDINAMRNLLGLVEATIENVTLPVLTAIEPTVTIPDAPDDALPTVPTDVPNVSDPSLPVAPGLDMPPVPVLDDISLPAAPILDSLQFDGVMPTADLTPPEPMFAYTEGTYSSDVADAIRTKLYNDITLGTAVYTEEVWTAIFERAMTDLNVELAKNYNQALSNWEQWNCEMPDGTLSSSLQEVLFEEGRNRTNLTRDIMYKRADLTQQATQFAITSGLVFEKQLMDYANQVANRAFEAAKFRVQAIIDVFKLKVDAFNARLTGYKVLAEVFESRIRAELAKVEVYRAQMEGAKILGELQVQKVQIYTARVNALQVVIDLYRAQMEGAKLQIDVDKNKIDAARLRIDAVIAQIQGITAKYNLYQARIAGETAKVELYGKQVTAFATQVDAAKVSSEINIAEIEAATAGNKDKISVLLAAIEQYKADIGYEVAKDETGAKVYTAQIAGYTAEVGREGEYLKALVDKYKAEVTEIMAKAEIAVKELDANLRAATAMKEVQIEALKAAALIQAQKVASALSSVSASAQIGFNGSVSDSYSRSASESEVNSTSHSDERGEYHNYNYSA